MILKGIRVPRRFRRVEWNACILASLPRAPRRLRGFARASVSWPPLPPRSQSTVGGRVDGLRKEVFQPFPAASVLVHGSHLDKRYSVRFFHRSRSRANRNLDYQ